MTRKICLVLTVLLAVSCSPRDELDRIITDANFIPFHQPLESFRVGTILRGNNKGLYVAARAATCFPDLPIGQPELRWLQETDLPRRYQSAEFNFSLEVNPIINGGNEILKFKMGMSAAHKVHIEFKGARIEYLDEYAFHKYHANGMPEDCKELLWQHPFIGQGLRVEGMTFVFKDSFGGKINLKLNLAKIVDIDGNVDWKLDDEYTLNILTPKYIGYQMAKLVDGGGGRVRIDYASSVDFDGNWIFRDVSQKPREWLSQLAPTGFVYPAEPLR